MKTHRHIFILIVTLVFTVICVAQNSEVTQPEENWLGKYGLYQDAYLFHRYDTYSKADVEKVRSKLDRLTGSPAQDEWEGFYWNSSQLSVAGFAWNSEVGYVSFGVYTCLPELRKLSHGSVANSADAIQIVPEFAGNSPRIERPLTYVKVKWGERRFLVAESSLAAFAEKAVGLYVESNEPSSPNFEAWSHFWIQNDSEDVYKGRPEFPSKYQHLMLSPVETKIASVGKRKIITEKELGDQAGSRYFEKTAWYSIEIDAGKNVGLRKGVWLLIPETGDEVYVEKVNGSKSIGLVPREIDENKNDVCRDENYSLIECRKLKPGFKTISKIGEFWSF